MTEELANKVTELGNNLMRRAIEKACGLRDPRIGDEFTIGRDRFRVSSVVYEKSRIRCIRLTRLRNAITGVDEAMVEVPYAQ